MTKHITHEVKSIVFPFGDITDPVTGKKVVAGEYRCETGVQTITDCLLNNNLSH